MKGYLIQYYNNKGNGFAIIGAPSARSAELILKEQGQFLNDFVVKSIKVIEGCFPTNTIVQEGVLTEALSAYDIAIKYGYEGTEKDWLESLNGKDFTYKDFTTEQLNNLKRPALESAELANKVIDEAESALSDVKSATKKANNAADRAEILSNNRDKIVDGYWWHYNEETGEYENTGVIAKGSVAYATFDIDLENSTLVMYIDPNYDGASFELDEENGLLKAVL